MPAEQQEGEKPSPDDKFGAVNSAVHKVINGTTFFSILGEPDNLSIGYCWHPAHIPLAYPEGYLKLRWTVLNTMMASHSEHGCLYAEGLSLAIGLCLFFCKWQTTSGRE